jgi:hypothetical protein
MIFFISKRHSHYPFNNISQTLLSYVNVKSIILLVMLSLSMFFTTSAIENFIKTKIDLSNQFLLLLLLLIIDNTEMGRKLIR